MATIKENLQDADLSKLFIVASDGSYLMKMLVRMVKRRRRKGVIIMLVMRIVIMMIFPLAVFN